MGEVYICIRLETTKKTHEGREDSAIEEPHPLHTQLLTPNTQETENFEYVQLGFVAHHV